MTTTTQDVASHMFEIMTPENTARVTMHNPVTGYSQEVLTGNDSKSIAYAIMCFAKAQHLEHHRVQYTTTFHHAPKVPANLPTIGATVHIRTNGPRKRAVAHTIAGYSQSPDGTWTYKAYDFAGWSHIDTVDSLFT